MRFLENVCPEARSFRTPPHLFLGVALLASPALAGQAVGGRWETPHDIPGDARLMSAGTAVSDAGDVDGDGYDDFIVGTREDIGAWVDVGSATVYSGRTGAVLHEFEGDAQYDRFGHSVGGAGDVDGDGFDDLVIGTPYTEIGLRTDTGSAFVMSGATGGELWRFNGTQSGQFFGWSVDGAGDVDGDGFDDLVVGSLHENKTGIVTDGGGAAVFSGRDGSKLFQMDGAATGDRLGCSVSGAGDVNGDGFGDFVIGAYGTEIGLRTDTGSAFVISGATGVQLWRFNGSQSLQNFGWSVSGCGDVNGDGYDDIVAGSLREDSPGVTDGGGASVYSGFDGARLLHFDGASDFDFLGCSVSGAGDVDGDGHADLVVGAYGYDGAGSNRGAAYVYSGASGDLLRLEEGASSFDQLGYSVSSAGDVHASGRGSVLIGIPFDDPFGLANAGSSRILSFDPFLGLTSSTLSASSGVPVHLSIDFPSSEAGYGYAVLASASGTGPSSFGGITLPLEQDSIFQMMIGPNVPAVFQNNIGTLNFNGDASASIQSDPLLAAVVGTTYFLAVASYDPNSLAGRETSIARTLRIVP